jgi:hypothetical protein
MTQTTGMTRMTGMTGDDTDTDTECEDWKMM